MARIEQEQADFEAAMGEAFADAVFPPVPFEGASPQACCEASQAFLGEEVAPELLARLSGAQLIGLSEQIGRYFDAPPPTDAQIRAGLAATLAR